jgi:dynactin complex subunit
MTDEPKIMVSAKIPISLHQELIDAVNKQIYKDKTACVTEALERLLRHTHQETIEEANVRSDVRQEPDNITDFGQNVRQAVRRSVRQGVLRDEGTLDAVLLELEDKTESLRLQAILLEKERQIEELQNHNSTLTKELDRASLREDDLKTMFNNHVMQVQTLINQKAIEAPGAKKPWWRFW